MLVVFIINIFGEVKHVKRDRAYGLVKYQVQTKNPLPNIICLSRKSKTENVIYVSIRKLTDTGMCSLHLL